MINGIKLVPQSYNDIHTLSTALAVAVQAQIISRDQATSALKEQLYACGVFTRPTVPVKIEDGKKGK